MREKEREANVLALRICKSKRDLKGVLRINIATSVRLRKQQREKKVLVSSPAREGAMARERARAQPYFPYKE